MPPVSVAVQMKLIGSRLQRNLLTEINLFLLKVGEVGEQRF